MNEIAMRGRMARDRAREYGGKSVDLSTPGVLVSARENNPAVHDAQAEEICLPPYHFVRCSPAERQVYDHPALQRLRRVTQLGGASLVFPSAEHTRFPHSLGVLEAVSRLMDTIDANIHDRAVRPLPAPSDWKLAEPFTPEERILVRLGALTHDIGHVPFGHTLEDELGLIQHHDDAVRFRQAATTATYRILGRTLPTTGERTRRTFHEGPLADLLQILYGPVLARILRTGSDLASKSSVLDLLVSLVARDQKLVPEKYDSSKFRLGLCRELLVGPVSADVIDYVPRDKLLSGVDAGHHNPRLLQYLVPMIEQRSSLPPTKQLPRIVIDLGSRRRVKTDAITAVHGLLESRFELTQVLYRHPVKCAAAAMLDRVMGELSARGILTAEAFASFTETLIQTFADEDQTLELIARKARSAFSDGSASMPPEVEDVLELLELLMLRRLHKTEISYSPAVGKEHFDHAVAKYSGAAGRGERLQLAQCLERDFELSAGDVAIYSSGPRPAVKDPDFLFALDGVVVNLDEVKTSSGSTAASVRELIGDYFRAQQERFSSLGRLEVLLSSPAVSQLDELELREVFTDTVRMALAPYGGKGLPGTGTAIRNYVSSKLGGRSVETNVTLAARGGGAPHESQTYPNGMPLLRGGS